MDLSQFFKQNNKVAVAFSGGVDSAYLLYRAAKSGADVKAYYVKSKLQPQFEYEDAITLAAKLNVPMQTICLDVLSCEEIVKNTADRCYHCKRRIFEAIIHCAKEDGYTLVLDGTNASDDATDRPGMKALEELSVRSPLRECGFTKDRIRDGARSAGLSTWDKPAYACLATRIKTGEAITEEKLRKTEAAELFLDSLGFRDFRVRMLGNDALLQLTKQDKERFYQNEMEILARLKRDYKNVTVDDMCR